MLGLGRLLSLLCAAAFAALSKVSDKLSRLRKSDLNPRRVGTQHLCFEPASLECYVIALSLCLRKLDLRLNKLTLQVVQISRKFANLRVHPG